MVERGQPIIWIKNPLDVFAENCEGGVVKAKKLSN